jgi:hypothetical protein
LRALRVRRRDPHVERGYKSSASASSSTGGRTSSVDSHLAETPSNSSSWRTSSSRPPPSQGVVAKQLSQRYHPGARGWVKIKNKDYWRYEHELRSLRRSMRRAAALSPFRAPLWARERTAPSTHPLPAIAPPADTYLRTEQGGLSLRSNARTSPAEANDIPCLAPKKRIVRTSARGVVFNRTSLQGKDRKGRSSFVLSTALPVGPLGTAQPRATELWSSGQRRAAGGLGRKELTFRRGRKG